MGLLGFFCGGLMGGFFGGGSFLSSGLPAACMSSDAGAPIRKPSRRLEKMDKTTPSW
jgi:hypothetical protein